MDQASRTVYGLTMSFAERLRRARVASGKTQRAIAEAVGVSVQAVSQWEKAQAVIQPDRIDRLAAALDVEAEWLRDGSKNKYAAVNIPEKLVERPDYGNVPVWVHPLSAISYYIPMIDEKEKKIDMSGIIDMIYVQSDRYVSPLAAYIENRDYEPAFQQGDIVVFDYRARAFPESWVVAVSADSNFIDFHAIVEGRQKAKTILIRYSDIDFGSGNRPSEDGHQRTAYGHGPAVAIIGPVIERRAFFGRPKPTA